MIATDMCVDGALIGVWTHQKGVTDMCDEMGHIKIVVAQWKRVRLIT